MPQKLGLLAKSKRSSAVAPAQAPRRDFDCCVRQASTARPRNGPQLLDWMQDYDGATWSAQYAVSWEMFECSS